MSIPKRKLAANRANAQKSTGATSLEGKEIVSHNRTTRGLCGRFTVLPNEDQDAYDALLADIMQAEKPVDAVERELVAKMVHHTWLSERAIRFQESWFILQPCTPEEEKNLEQWAGVQNQIVTCERYQAHHEPAVFS